MGSLSPSLHVLFSSIVKKFKLRYVVAHFDDTPNRPTADAITTAVVVAAATILLVLLVCCIDTKEENFRFSE